jgi:hypothetical protein
MLSIKLKLLGVASVYLWHMMASASAFAPSSLSIDAGATRLTTTLPSSRVPLRPLSAGDNNNTRRYANGIGGFDLLSKTKKSVSISSSVPASTKNGVINISKKKALPTKAASSPPNKKSIIKSNMVNVINKNSGKVGTKNNVKQVDASSPTQTPWSTILLSFLIPWRNPNSIFLYMLLAVSVLGKLNEHPH